MARWGYRVQSVNADLMEIRDKMLDDSALLSDVLACNTMLEISQMAAKRGLSVPPEAVIVYQALSILSAHEKHLDIMVKDTIR